MSSTPPKYEDTISTHGSAFINSLTYITPNSAHPHGLIVSGGKDAIIDVRQPGQQPESDAYRLLLGHEGNVCAMDVWQDAKAPWLVSGSWDASGVVWDVEKGTSVTELKGHEASVWAVLAYDEGTIITGMLNCVM
jgi:phospholipase A-2-activating protein